MIFSKNDGQDALEKGIYSLVLLQESNLLKAIKLAEKCFGNGKSGGFKYDSDEYYADPAILYYPAFDAENRVIFVNSRLCLYLYMICAVDPYSVEGTVCQAFIDLSTNDLDVKSVSEAQGFDPRKIFELTKQMASTYSSIKNNPDNRAKLQEIDSIIRNPTMLKNALLKMKK